MKDAIRSYIPAECPWRDTLYWFPTIDSTNTQAKKLTAAGAPHGTVVIAGHQSAGRGRMGRSFHSPEGLGLYLSIILRPQCTPEELMHLFVSRNSMMRGTLAGAQWEWQGEHLVIHLRGNGKAELEELFPAVQQELRERFAAPVTISAQAGQTLEGKALFEAMESMRGQMIETMPAAAARQEKKEDKAAAAAAESGDVVLMSPASASFDEFKNFAVRGDFFKKLIMEL